MSNATKTPWTLGELPMSHTKGQVPRSYNIYLAGQVSGLSYAAVMNRRAEIAAMFPAHIFVLNPLDHQKDLKGVEVITPFMGDSDAIICECFWMIEYCDLVLVDLIGATQISVGACVEIGYAIRACIPIVVMIRADDMHQHPFITVPARFVCDTEAKAVAEISAMLKA